MTQAAALSTTSGWRPEDTFGARLALVRQHKGWNVKQAAEHCGVPPTTWHEWENGRLPADLSTVARQIAAASGCDLMWLLVGGAA